MVETTTIWRPHTVLEESVKKYLEQSGFETFSLTYHESLPYEITETLKTRWSFTALYLRGRADRFAIHRTLPIEFEFEVKTHRSRKFHDITIEALPLAHHILKSWLGTECLYIYHDSAEENQYGFWIRDIPKVREIIIPKIYCGGRKTRTDDEMADWKDKLSFVFPGIPLKTREQVGGSNDPFVIIDKEEKIKLSDWRDLINQLIPVELFHELHT